MRARRWVCLAALAVIALAGVLYFLRTRDGSDPEAYPAALAELDRDYPGWRLPPADNPAPLDPAAALIGDVAARLPWDDPPPARFSGPPLVGKEYAPPPEAFAAAGRLADLPDATGAAPPLGPRDWLPGPPPDGVRDATQVARLLYWGGDAAAARGDYPAAARAAAAIARIGRALAPDPRPTAGRVRLECASLVTALVERVPTGGSVPDPVLAQLAGVLGEQPPMRIVEFAWADRAVCHACLEEARTGSLRHPDLPPTLWEPGRHARALRAMTLTVAFAQAHAGEALPAVREALLQLDAEFRALGPTDRASPAGRAWAYLRARHLGAMVDLVADTAASNARLRAARVGVAAERFRVRTGRWPAGPGDLVPGLLAAWPEDPRDGRPLRLVRVNLGLMVVGARPVAAGRAGGGQSGRPLGAPGAVRLHPLRPRTAGRLPTAAGDGWAVTRPAGPTEPGPPPPGRGGVRRSPICPASLFPGTLRV
ncbi:MAG: hypothetical protein JWO38_6343 [Gemmataceae bacterium]|nr:hypothetical protein [Gemmataceae bacterium]